MNYFKRALTSVSRRKMKSLILLFIVVILGNIMLSTLLIVQSVDSTKLSILKELPPVVTLQIDYEKLEELYDEHGYEQELDIKYITYDDLDRIGTTSASYIKSYDYSSTWHIETKSLEAYTSSEENFFEMPGQANYFYLKGVENPSFTILETGDAKISEGRTFTKEEIEKGNPVFIMGKELAEVNDLVVGDNISIECIFSDYVITERGEEQVILETITLDFQLIGLLEYKEIPSNNMHGKMDFDESYWYKEEQNRTFFSSNRLVANFRKESMEMMRPHYEKMYGEDFYSEQDDNPLAWTPITYFLNSSEEVNDFVNTTTAALGNDYYHFVTQEDNFKNIAQPLESMKRILTYAFYVAVGSAILVLTLVLIGFLKDRQKEIGIYLALGEKKSKITGQMIIETVIVGLAGATLAIFTGMFLASFISDMMINISNPDEYHVFMDSFSPSMNYNSILESYKISLSYISIILFYIAITVTMVTAQLFSSIYILRFDPKKIMM